MEITQIVSVRLYPNERFEIEPVYPSGARMEPVLVHRVIMRADGDMAELNGDKMVPVADLPEHIRALKPQQPVYEYAICSRFLTEVRPDDRLGRWSNVEDARAEVRSRGVEKTCYVIRRVVGSNTAKWEAVQ